MAIEVPLLPLSEEEIRSMANESVVDPEVESYLRTMQSDITRALELHVEEFPSLAHLDFVGIREGYAVAIRDAAGADGEDLRHCAAVFEAGRSIPCEEDALLVSELRSQAAWCDARRAEAGALAADARRLRDRYLREMAATKDPQEEAGLVTAAASDFLAFLAKELDGGVAPEADAARAKAMDAAARAGHGVGARFAATFVGLAGRVRRLAEAYAAGGQDEDAAVAEGLRRRADEVEALCADPEALLEQIFDSGWYTFWKYGPVWIDAEGGLTKILATPMYFGFCLDGDQFWHAQPDLALRPWDFRQRAGETAARKSFAKLLAACLRASTSSFLLPSSQFHTAEAEARTRILSNGWSVAFQASSVNPRCSGGRRPVGYELNSVRHYELFHFSSSSPNGIR